jgi:hypothetical protein
MQICVMCRRIWQVIYIYIYIYIFVYIQLYASLLLLHATFYYICQKIHNLNLLMPLYDFHGYTNPISHFFLHVYMHT